jgi:hypothetical protein
LILTKVAVERSGTRHHTPQDTKVLVSFMFITIGFLSTNEVVGFGKLDKFFITALWRFLEASVG